VGAKAAEDLKSVDAGQHDVEYHQIDAGLTRPFQAAVAFVFALHCEAFAFEELTEQSAQLRVVVDQQEVHG
jgi:hypothetical protein